MSRPQDKRFKTVLKETVNKLRHKQAYGVQYQPSSQLQITSFFKVKGKKSPNARRFEESTETRYVERSGLICPAPSHCITAVNSAKEVAMVLWGETRPHHTELDHTRQNWTTHWAPSLHTLFLCFLSTCHPYIHSRLHIKSIANGKDTASATATHCPKSFMHWLEKLMGHIPCKKMACSRAPCISQMTKFMKLYELRHSSTHTIATEYLQ